MDFEISDDVPPPPDRVIAKRTGKPGRPAIYPFAEMEVGQSVFLPRKKSASAISGCFKSAWAKGYAFTTKAENGGLRVWRIA